MKKILNELTWRGLIQNCTPGIFSIENNKITLYTGLDPTSDSLHIGNLIPISILIHFKNAGHNPLIIIGGATALIGDPSDKNTERQLLDNNIIEYNINSIKSQLYNFLDIYPNGRIKLLNNYDWIKNISFLNFVRNIGKYITINYMIAKDYVKKRLNNCNGMSFTEFTYQLIQGYDFFYLYKTKNCLLQIGGSDQWGNIITGIELIKKKLSGIAYGLTVPLITKNDGSKLGKTQKGTNIWLNPKRTSPYKFYQFWLNISDNEAEKFIKYYTFLSKFEIEQLIIKHRQSPNKRLLQKKIASEITKWIHGNKAYEKAVNTSEILFSKNIDELKKINKDLSIFNGVPHLEINKEFLEKGITIVDVLVTLSNFLSSKNAVYRLIHSKAILVNKTIIYENLCLTTHDLIDERFILIQISKKKFFVIKVI
ncbi:MAG: tyrosine--tRNA ligase [Candidatus Bostrichicola ureolyticus]|nr:MAG: tyrosine--tRNA ligase [Candidatus Bostrichicola ureolyticus]